MKPFPFAVLWLSCLLFSPGLVPAQADTQPNVVFIICDDLNDYVEGFGGHPDAVTPNMARLARSGVTFTQAHCNIPICGPSRASLFTGIYPHNSGCFGFTRWDTYEILKNSRTMMDHFRANGYYTLGTGKLMHHMVRQEWQGYGNRADYGPFAFDGTDRVAHPDVPSPYRDIGAIDGSFGPLTSLDERTFSGGKTYSWQTGGWGQVRELKVGSLGTEGMTADELNGQWAVEKLHELADHKSRKPFFVGVGFIRPHTPLIVPKRFFDMFPLNAIKLPVIKPEDVDDTHANSIRGLTAGTEPDSERTEDMGSRLFRALVETYGSEDDALRRFIQAYLASVASVDEQIGKILDALESTGLDDNTIVILTSDHGWGMGEKDYLYKNSLWQESTPVPLMIRLPGIAKKDQVSPQPVSLIDLYPTLVDVCGLTGDTKKNGQGHSLDGHSLKPLLVDPDSETWPGPDAALTALYKWPTSYEPSGESYSLRSRDWRYIRYENGKEELYHTTDDPYEWTNLADNPDYAARCHAFRQQLQSRLPEPGYVPPQPAFEPKVAVKAKTAEETKSDAEAWKDKYFAKHPDADMDKNGNLTWPEYKTHKAAHDAAAN